MEGDHMAPQTALEKTTRPHRPYSLLIAWPLAAVGIVVFWNVLYWQGLKMSVSLATLTSLLSPIAFAAAVVERAVEILISPWRDTGASKLQRALAAIQARPAEAAKAADLQTASGALDDYRGVTQQYAFAVSMLLSLLVSISGVRALQPFLAENALNVLATNQRGFFFTVDVLLTALLLSGGADGVHSIVNAVTTFFDATGNQSVERRCTGAARLRSRACQPRPDWARPRPVIVQLGEL
jgi:hypothetical protein